MNEHDIDAVIAKLEQALNAQVGLVDVCSDGTEVLKQVVCPSDPVLDAYLFLCSMRELER